MATTTDITIFIESSGSPVTSGAFDLRTTPFAVAGVSGTHEGTGVWRFDAVAQGQYRLFNTTAGTYAGWGGDSGTWIYDGDVDAADVNAGTFTGAFTHDTQLTLNAGASTDTISEKTSATGVTVDGVLLKDDLTTSNIASLSGAQTFTGDKTINSLLFTIAGATALVISSTVRPQIGSASTTSKDASGAVRRKDEIDADIASAINGIVGFQASARVRYVYPSGTDVPGRDYNTIAKAVGNILSVGIPSSANRYAVFVADGGNSGNVNMSHADMADYVDIISLNPNIGLIIGSLGESLTETATMTVKGFKVWFGNGVLAGARTYTNVSWDSCRIYAYNDTTFGGTGSMVNSNVYSASGNTQTITGAIELADCSFSQALTFSTRTGILTRPVQGGVNTGITMPPDPTVAA